MTTTADHAEGQGPSAPPGPRIYAHSWTLMPVMGPPEAARFAAENGFAGLELFCNPCEFWPGLIPAATLDALGAIERDEGIEYSLYGGYTLNAATRLPELKALDIETVKRTLEVAAHVGAMVVPGSGLVKRQAEDEGLDAVFTAAGFEWREPGCSMCLAMNPDKLAPGERCASTSNRNFEGRQGRGGRTHLVSPVMAAAAALTGRLTDVRELM